MKKKIKVVKNRNTMRVITPYPIYKNGRRVNKKSVTIKSNFDNDNFSFIDGKSSSAEIKKFQTWYNGTLSLVELPIPVSGKWDTATQNAWSAKGTGYKGSAPTGNSSGAKLPTTSDGILDAISKGAKTYQDVANIFRKQGKTPPTKEQYNAVKNKKQKMSTMTKVFIAIGVVAGVVLLVKLAKK